MVNDERPATYQIPGRGSLKDHVEYHKMLLTEFRHTTRKAADVPPMNCVHHKRMRACKILMKRLNLHWMTAREQLDIEQFRTFAFIFEDPRHPF